MIKNYQVLRVLFPPTDQEVTMFFMKGILLRFNRMFIFHFHCRF